MQKNTPSLKISEKDNLLVALKDLMPGQQVITDNESFNLTEKIPAKHKFAGQNFSAGDLAYMYGVLVGEATCPIQAGDRITIENLIHRSAEFSAGKGSKSWTSPSTKKWKNKTFLGYHRSDGSVGTANYWLVVPLVFCENGNIEILKRSMTKALGFNKRSQYESFSEELAKAYQNGDSPANVQLPQENTNRPSPIFPNIDGVKFLTHGLGCGETRGVSNELCGLLAGYACNPNVAGITVLSLGCQHAQVSIMEEEISKRCANFDKLCLGMECGASDGFSGISANPCIGHVADLTVGLNGRVILSEFPELCGVEQEIVNRCESTEIGNRFITIMRNYEERVKEAGSGFHMNPSPGNVKDGLITDAIKSAGAARKGGTSPVVDVFDYPGWVKKDGLSLLCTAGNDVESTTAMAGAGANLILFSTGLGTPTGNPISPVIKIASNSTTAQSFIEYIDFDTGSIIDGSESVESLGEKLLDEVIAYASGIKKTKADLQGRDDFLPWKRGMSL